MMLTPNILSEEIEEYKANDGQQPYHNEPRNSFGRLAVLQNDDYSRTHDEYCVCNHYYI